MSDRTKATIAGISTLGDSQPMPPSNLFTNIPDSLPEELFELLAESNSVKIERIVSKGHTSPGAGWYYQDRNEWVIVLKGSATLMFDDDSTIDLAEGDYINIPAHKRHRVTRTSTNPATVWLAVHY